MAFLRFIKALVLVALEIASFLGFFLFIALTISGLSGWLILVALVCIVYFIVMLEPTANAVSDSSGDLPGVNPGDPL